MRFIKTFKILLLLVILAGIFAGYYVARRVQVASINALTPSSVGDVTAVSGEVKDGLVPVTLMFRTGISESQKEAISTVSFRLNVSSVGGKKVTLVDKDNVQMFKIETGESIKSENNWEVPVNISQNNDLGFSIDFALSNTAPSGYESVSQQKLGTFYVKGVEAGSDLKLVFEKSNSFMFSKRRPITDIWVE